MFFVSVVILIAFVSIAGNGNATKQLLLETKANKINDNQAPKRVVAVWQNSIETLLELGLGDRIIAANGLPDKKYLKASVRDMYEKIPNKSFRLYDLETTMMLNPDFILGWQSTFRDTGLRSPAFWNPRGVRTYIAKSTMKQTEGKVKKRKIEDEYSYIKDLGKIFKVETKANAIVEGMKKKIMRVQTLTKDKKKPKVLIIEFMGKKITVYNDQTLAGDIAKAVNGDLINPKLRAIGKEDIIKYNPDVVFVIIVEREYEQKDKILERTLKDPAFKNLSFVKNKRIYAAPLYTVYSSGSRTLDGIEIFAKRLHPKLY